jgi:hypothetical protein
MSVMGMLQPDFRCFFNKTDSLLTSATHLMKTGEPISKPLSQLLFLSLRKSSKCPSAELMRFTLCPSWSSKLTVTRLPQHSPQVTEKMWSTMAEALNETSSNCFRNIVAASPKQFEIIIDKMK